MTDEIKTINLAIHMLSYCEDDDGGQMSTATSMAIKSVVQAWGDFLLMQDTQAETMTKIKTLEDSIAELTSKFDSLEFDINEREMLAAEWDA